MRLIDRYLFRQLLGPTLFVTCALSVLAVLAEALSAIGILLNQRQSLIVFVEVVLLAMPQLIALILPIAVLIAGLVSLNRLERENEIAICFAAGMSRWRVMAPAIRLSALFAMLSLAITLWIQPLCYRTLRDVLQDVRADLVATMIRAGQFTHPALGVTVFAQSVDEDGVIHNLFMDRRLADGRDITFTATDGQFKHRVDGPWLIMRHGESQELSPAGAVSFLSFDNYIIDLRPFIGTKSTVRYKLSDRYMHELVWPDKRMDWERSNIGPMLAEANARLATPIYAITFMMLAIAAILGGDFSRMGYGRRVAAVCAVGLVTRVVGFAVQNASGGSPLVNILQYATPILVAVLCLWTVFRAKGFASAAGAVTMAAGR